MLRHSSTIRTGLHGHIRQTQEEHTLRHYNAQYIVSAEFDNKLGPVVKHQYPKTIPGFKGLHGNGNGNGTSNLASLMIPNNIESTPGKPDFTVFILYKDKLTQSHKIFPLDESPQSNGSGTINNSTILEEDENVSSEKGKNKRELKSEEPPLFFINVVKAKTDATDMRGTIIRSIAIGTTLKNFHIFKPLLMMTLIQYMSSSSDVQILIDCFNMINSLDLSLVNRIHSNVVLQNILNSINNEDIIADIFDPKGKSLRNILRVNELPSQDGFGNVIHFKRRYLEYQFTRFTPKVLPAFLAKIPLQIDLINYDPIKIDINYNDHVLKFLTKFIPQVSKLQQGQFCWRLIVNSTKLTKDTLCQFVISLSNFIKCFDFQYFNNSSVIIFPYMDISLVDDFRKEFASSKKQRPFFSIVGVSNPIFECQRDAWDFYYDMDTDILRSQIVPEHSSGAEDELLKNIKLKKMFQRESTSSGTLSHGGAHMGLMLKLIMHLVEEQHDNQTILNVFKRASLLQLMNLLKNLETSPNSRMEMTLKDEYIAVYKDFIVFPEFFEYGTLKVLRVLYDLERHLDQLFFYSNKGVPKIADHRRHLLKEVFSALKKIYKFISVNKINMGKFLNVCLNVPSFYMFESADLTTTDFTNIDLRDGVSLIGQNTQSLDSSTTKASNVIDIFNLRKSFNLLTMPLLLNPFMEAEENIMEMGPPDLLGHHSRASGEPLKTAFQSDSSLSMISSIYENNTEQGSYMYDTNDGEYSVRDDITMLTGRDRDLSSLVTKIRKMSIKILYRIDRHHIGKLLLNEKLNPLFLIAYQTLKHEYFGPEKEENTSSTDKDTQKRYSSSPGSPLIESHMSVSPIRADFSSDMDFIFDSEQDHTAPSRKDLLNDLNMISEQQEHIKLAATSEGSDVTKSSILDALEKIEISHNAS